MLSWIFSFFYDSVLFIFLLLISPNIIWQGVRYGKYRSSIKNRFGIGLPDLKSEIDSPIIWLHAVSVGETRALIPFFQKIRLFCPEARIVISTTTETGLREARKWMPEAKAHFFLPLDFYWIIQKALKKINPTLLCLVESDFWYHLMTCSKKKGAKVILINGKMSDRSFKRFRFCSFFSKLLFSQFDKVCVQSVEMERKFIESGVESERVAVTGNLKFDVVAKKIVEKDLLAWKEELGIKQEDRVVVIGSTHELEEAKILSALGTIWDKFPLLKIILVPRHPERFSKVAYYLKETGFNFLSYSKREEKTGNEKIILLDTMGLLRTCYQIAELAIVGGSFISGVGGHNIFEPLECGAAVLFGPHMESQTEMVELILKYGAGEQLMLNQLERAVSLFLSDEIKREKMFSCASKLIKEIRGSSSRTWEEVALFFKHESINCI